MRNKLGDEVRLLHMKDAISIIENYLNNISYNDFSNNLMLRDAVNMQMAIIGEAADHVSEKIKEKYSNVKWYEVKAFRNILVHEYFRLEIKIIWNILKNDLPILKKQIYTILSENFNFNQDQE